MLLLSPCLVLCPYPGFPQLSPDHLSITVFFINASCFLNLRSVLTKRPNTPYCFLYRSYLVICTHVQWSLGHVMTLGTSSEGPLPLIASRLAVTEGPAFTSPRPPFPAFVLVPTFSHHLISLKSLLFLLSLLLVNINFPSRRHYLILFKRN